MITMKELGVPVRSWVPDWLGFCCIFIVILPVTMLNGSYTGSKLEGKDRLLGQQCHQLRLFNRL